ncbi:MAG TPA: ABC transporter permease [Candidatus Acidoferrales bacterium]|jgi:predicted permease|nr:ABC transporter permease [Candidatus Acidoferrales bacterium]
MKIWKRIQLLARRRKFEEDLAEEMRIHREMAAETLGPEGARAFGSVALSLEDSRAVWGLAWLDSWLQDLRYAARGFRKTPGFALTVIGTIGLALGLNTTVFTVFDSYMLKPYAVRDPYGLYSFTWVTTKGQGHDFTWQEYSELARQKGVFTDSFAYQKLFAGADGHGMFGQLVSGNYFTMTGAGMTMGRPILPEDAAAPGSGAVMVLSYPAWKNKFGGDAGIIGRKVFLRGQPMEVVGVADPAFAGLETVPVEFWVPLTMHFPLMGKPDLFGPGHPAVLEVIGRLHPGTSVDVAKAALAGWAAGMTADRPKDQQAVAAALFSKATSISMTNDAIATFSPFFVAFGLVLLIACANVSNMMLARALARQREMGIRVSLGAGRARLIRQLLTESLLLAVPAAVAGFLISELTIQLAERLLWATLPPAFAKVVTMPNLAPDARVFGFILLASAAATLLFGLVPAVQTTGSSLVQANRGDFSNDYRPTRLRNALVVMQVTVCALLLICAGVVLRSARWVAQQNVGLDTHNVLDLRMAEKYQAKVAERLAGEPVVEAMTAAWKAPLYGESRHISVVAAGRKESVGLSYNLVSGPFFSVFRIPVLRGRTFTAEETNGGAPVVLVSETAARRLFPDRDALGQAIALQPREHRNPYYDRVPGHANARVIGIVKDAITGTIANGPDIGYLYFPTSARDAYNDSLLVRVKGDSAAARRALVAALDQIAPSLADQINPMDDVFAVQIYPFRIMFWLSSFLGGLGLVLTASGIYGVMSYLVSQRTKEIGIRVALGADVRMVIAMVVKQSMRLAAVGTVAGIGLTLAVAPVFAHELKAINPYDVVAYAGGMLLVLAAVLAASFYPSRRAARIDPSVTLRCD